MSLLIKIAREREEGQALIEFALFFSLFALIFAGIVDFSIFIRQDLELTWAAEAGAAYGTVPGHSTDTAGITFAASQAAPDISGMSISVSDVYACSPGGSSVGGTSTCTDGYPPMKFVQVQTGATVSSVFTWAGLTKNITMQGFASDEVPWS